MWEREKHGVVLQESLGFGHLRTHEARFCLLLEPAWPLRSGASSGLTMEQRQDLAFEAFCVCECVGVSGKPTISGNVSALAPCRWQLGQHRCQPQRVNGISSELHGEQPTQFQ